MERMMPVRVLIAVLVVVLIVGLALAADQGVKAARRWQRRREASERLAAAAADAEAKLRKRKAAEQASGALTSVMPTIYEMNARTVGTPGLPENEAPAGPGPRGEAPAGPGPRGEAPAQP
jgi:type II secretory pathway pseudopilin PulG